MSFGSSANVWMRSSSMSRGCEVVKRMRSIPPIRARWRTRRPSPQLPSASEPAGGRGAELVVEIDERTERVVDRLPEQASGRAAAVRAHVGPEQGVVDVAAPVVSHGRSDVVRNRVEADVSRLRLRVQDRLDRGNFDQ